MQLTIDAQWNQNLLRGRSHLPKERDLNTFSSGRAHRIRSIVYGVVWGGVYMELRIVSTFTFTFF
jgi:hypothetical protein